MKRQPRFEIVRSGGLIDGSQQWHARFRAANGLIVWTTEQYARRQGVERAIRLTARAFWGLASFSYDETGVLFIGDRGERYVEIREVDER